MKLPNNYVTARQAIPVDEISFGVGGIKLFSADKIEEGQIGYSIAPEWNVVMQWRRGFLATVIPFS